MFFVHLQGTRCSFTPSIEINCSLLSSRLHKTFSFYEHSVIYSNFNIIRINSTNKIKIVSIAREIQLETGQIQTEFEKEKKSSVIVSTYER